MNGTAQPSDSDRSGTALPLRDALVKSVNGNPITADEAWALIHAWDDLHEAVAALQAEVMAARRLLGQLPASEVKRAAFFEEWEQAGKRRYAALSKCLCGLPREDSIHRV